MKQSMKCYELSDEFRSILLDVLSSDFIPLLTPADIKELNDAELRVDDTIFESISVINIPNLYDVEVILIYGTLGDSCTATVKEKLSPELVSKYVRVLEKINEKCTTELSEHSTFENITAISLSLGYQIMKDNTNLTVRNQLFRTVLSDSSGMMYDTAKLIFDPKIVPDQDGVNIANMFMILSNVNEYFNNQSNFPALQSAVPSVPVSFLKFEVMAYMLTSIQGINYFTKNLRTNPIILNNIIHGTITLVSLLNRIDDHIKESPSTSPAFIQRILGLRRNGGGVGVELTESMNLLESIIFAIALTPEQPSIVTLNISNMDALRSLIFSIESISSNTFKQMKMQDIKIVSTTYKTIASLIMSHCEINGGDDISRLHELTPITIMMMEKIFTNSNINREVHFNASKKIIKSFTNPASLKVLISKFDDDPIQWMDAMDEAMILLNNYTSFVEIMTTKDIVMMLTENKGDNVDLELGKLCSNHVISMKEPTLEMLNKYVSNNDVLYDIIVSMMNCVKMSTGASKAVPTLKTGSVSFAFISNWLNSDIEGGELDGLLRPTTFRNKVASEIVLSIAEDISRLIDERSQLGSSKDFRSKRLDRMIDIRIMFVEALVLHDLFNIFEGNNKLIGKSLEQIFKIIDSIDDASRDCRDSDHISVTEADRFEDEVYYIMDDISGRILRSVEILLRFLVYSKYNDLPNMDAYAMILLSAYTEIVHKVKTEEGKILSYNHTQGENMEYKSMIKECRLVGLLCMDSINVLGIQLKNIIRERTVLWGNIDAESFTFNRTIDTSVNNEDSRMKETLKNFWYSIKTFVIGEDTELEDVRLKIEETTTNINRLMSGCIHDFNVNISSSSTICHILQNYYCQLGVVGITNAGKHKIYENRRYTAFSISDVGILECNNRFFDFMNKKIATTKMNKDLEKLFDQQSKLHGTSFMEDPNRIKKSR